MKDVLNVKPVLLKQNAPEMDAFQQRLFNSQRETYFWLKPDAPKTNAFHVKDVVSIEPFLFDTMPPKWMPFVATVLNAKPFFVSYHASHMDAFSVNDFVDIESFLFDIYIAPETDDGRCSQCQPLVLFVQVLEKTL